MLTSVVLTHNETDSLVACLKSLSWCDKLLVIDDQSSKSIHDIALKQHAEFISHPLSGDFSAQRNFALKQIQTDWALFIDADEIVSPGLASEIIAVLSNPSEINGYYLPRQDFLWGKLLRYGDTGQINILRLGRKDHGVWEGMVHETWKIRGATPALKNPILHSPHASVAEFASDLNFYSSIRANELYAAKKTASVADICLYPAAKLFQNYVFRLGFMDGNRGFIHAALMAFYSFLVRSKLYLLCRQ